MTKREALCRRKAIEKKYTKLAIKKGLLLEQGHDGRFFSVSPGKIYHLEGGYDGFINYKAINEYSRLSEIIHNHNGERQDVEKKINKILVNKNGFTWKTYELKQYFFGYDFEEMTKELRELSFKQINKRQFAELNNLFKKFAELSKEEHYTLSKGEVKAAKQNIKKLQN